MAASPQMAPRHVAHLSTAGGFLGVGGWRPDPVPVLTSAAAAEELRQDPPRAALLWLDEPRRELVVSLRGSCGATEEHRLGQKLDVAVASQQQQGPAGVTVSLEGRAARELVQQLTRHALPTWERICAEAARRCLVLLGDTAWLAFPHGSGEAGAILLERTDGRARAAVVLDVRRAQVLLRPLTGCTLPNSAAEPVRTLEEAVRALAKSAAPRQQLDRSAAAAVSALQQHATAVGLHRALAAVEADVGDGSVSARSGSEAVAAQMVRWLDAGLVPALVGHAAACTFPHPPAGAAARAHSAAPNRPGSHRHAAAIASVLVRAGPARAAQQARLALRCIAARLDCAPAAAAGPLLQLLASLLDLARASHGPDGAQLQQGQQQQQIVARRALCDAAAEYGLLLEALQGLYARVAWHLPAAEMLAKLRAVGVGASHVIGDDPDAPSSSARGPLASLLRSPAPSEPGSPARRPSVVPRLSLPLSVSGSTPGTASRRSGPGTMEPRGSARGALASDRTGEPNVLALRRLGYACGQSAMCADLAAFVAHKHHTRSSTGGGAGSARSFSRRGTADGVGGASASWWTPRHAALDHDSALSDCGSEDSQDTAVPAAVADRAASAAASATAGGGAASSTGGLPEPLRVKLLALTCLARVAACYAAAGCVPAVSPASLLVSELLVPEDDMRALAFSPGCGISKAAVTGSSSSSSTGGGRSGSQAADPDVVAAAVVALRRASIGVVAAFGRLSAPPGGASAADRLRVGAAAGGCAGGVGPRGSADDTVMLDARPKVHDDVVAQLRHRLARLLGQGRDALRDPALLRASSEPLLVLHRYLRALSAPTLADAVVAQAQEPLARLELAVRAAQPRLLQPEALGAVEALARVYASLLRLGGRAGATRSWLISALGCSAPGSAGPGGGGVSSTAAVRGSFSGGDGWESPRPSDTLRLMLDVLRTRPYSGAAGASSSGGGGALEAAPAGLAASPGRPRRSLPGGGSGPGTPSAGSAGGFAAALGLSRLGAVSGSGSGSGGVGSGGGAVVGLRPQEEARLRLWLWRFVTELLRFALRHPDVKHLAAPLSGGWFPPASLEGSLWTRSGSCSAALGTPIGGPPAPSRSFGARAAVAAAAAAAAAGPQGSGTGGFGTEAAGGGVGPLVVELLADELLRSRGGRPLAIRHLEDAASGPGMAAVQRQVLEFLREMAAAPNSPLLSSPQLSDFYVRHHFLQLVRLYHSALSTDATAGSDGGAPAPAAAVVVQCVLRACRGHLAVLLELASHAPAGGGARRAFLQLHVADFLVRELSLERGAARCAVQSSRTPSSLGTPAASAAGLRALQPPLQQQQQPAMPVVPPSGGPAAEQSSPLKARRLAPRVGVANAQHEAVSPLQPQPPEGPRPPAIPCLALPMRTPQPSTEPPVDAAAAPGTGPATELPESPVASSSGSEAASPGRCDGATPEPPQPTGDLSEDLAAIEEWEERTGKVYNFGGLSDAEGGGGGSSESEDGGSLGSPAAASPSPPRRLRGGRVPSLALHGGSSSGGMQLAPLALGGPLPAAAAGDDGNSGSSSGSGSSRQGGSEDGGSSAGTSYRPGYDLEEDFARGYLPEGVLDSPLSGASAGSGLIPASRGGGGGGGASGSGGSLAAGEEWGSSSGSSGGAGSSGCCSEDEAADGGNPAARRSLGPVPALRPSSKVIVAAAVVEPVSAPPVQQQQQPQHEPEQRQQQRLSSAASNAGPAGAASWDPEGALASYRAHRQAHPLYSDPGLQELILRVVAALLLTPEGLLDPLALPKDPADTQLQQQVLVLRDHLSHPDNAAIVDRLLPGLRGPCSAAGNGSAGSGDACGSVGGEDGGRRAAAGLRRLLRLTAAGLFDASPYVRERDGQLASGAYGSTAKYTLFHPALSRPLPVVIKSVSLAPVASAADASNFEKVFSEVAALEVLAGTPGVVPLIDYGLSPDGAAFRLAFPRYEAACGGRPAAAGGRAGPGNGGAAASAQGAGPVEVPFALALADFGEAAVYPTHSSGISSTFGTADGDGAAAGAEAPGAVLGGGGGGGTAAAIGFTTRPRGTAAFNSPEMHMLGSGSHAREHAHYDRRRLRGAGRPHDVWGLGCCLYELLTGRPPFADEPEPALWVCSALEADTRRRAEARRDGTAHRQASVLRPSDRSALAALLPPALAPPLPGPATGSPAAVQGMAKWLQRQVKRAAGRGADKGGSPLRQQQEPRYGGLAGRLLDLIDSILVLDAVHRPGLPEVERRVRRVLAEMSHQ